MSAAVGRDETTYHGREQGSRVEMENPRHGLRVRFSRKGVWVEHRGHVVTLVWAERTHSVEPAVEANRVEYRREGLTEWYVNGPLGLQQGFTVGRPPVGAGEVVRLRLRVGGSLTPQVGADGRSLVWADGRGQAVLVYRGLTAWDAQGKELPVRLGLEGEVLVLEVEAAEAVYPVTVDPWVQQAKLTASDGAANDEFGGSVSVSGDTVVVGAPGPFFGIPTTPGAAYVFVRSGSTWTQQAKLTASDGAVGDWFGFSVSISGDTVVVGAPLADVSGNTDQGAAYVFVRSGSTWTQQAKLTASDGAAGDEFGVVSISGDTVVVGALLADVSGNADQGAAYVFVRSGSTWTQQAKLMASDGAAGDEFGLSVSISGDAALVGAPLADVSGNIDQGAAYVFVRSGSIWTQQAKLTASDGAVGDVFGFFFSAALSGGTAAVGARFADVSGHTNQGAAYVFRGTGVWYIHSVGSVSFGAPPDTPVPADYDGDGKADIAVVRDMGTFLRWFISGVGTFDFGKPGDVPVPADYDGDGKADIAVFRPSTGQWFILGVGTFTFGTSTDRPVPADYNGDGKADIAVFRPSTGQWFIFGVGTFTFGTSTDRPVPADYNGDGKADIAVFRPSTGQWFIFGVGTFTFGTSTDRPVPADYDGDHKANIAVFR